ncbi:FtsW/RodA/SpoVE family cell cycle protein [Paracnuella aquatica]|uniref:FtsW/RodA/SpoVE family cell cycle protein n=1 Tax=Paracnuella aquatica TaxID=2268757 RepID=UPI000DEEB20F|nr:FtsW/RodA/SpoVE family cell cycle protein [Paracnuella aquatica]RPD51554.1 cell cycle protein [Paracnuella aquatica]
MATAPIHNPKRNTERLFLLLASVVLGLLFYQLHSVLQRDFTQVPQRIADGSMVNLNSDNPGQRLKQLLQKGFYFDDRRDIALITSTVTQNLRSDEATIDNIGELNKRKYFVNGDQAFAQGGASFQKRVKVSRGLLGFAGGDSLRYEAEQKAPAPLAPQVNAGAGSGRIEVEIENRDGNAVAGVLVRLQMILPEDSLYSNRVVEVAQLQTEKGAGFEKEWITDSLGAKQLQGLVAYARTNADGEVQFEGLPEERAFAVLPLQPGFQFGASKGVEALDGKESFSFVQQPHTIRLLATRDFNNLKKEGALIVRMPDEVNKWYWILAAVFFASFWLLHVFLSLKLPRVDQLIVPAIFLLVGFSFLTLLSLQDPLRDRFLAKDMLLFFSIGMAGIFILLLFDLRKFTTDSGLYRLFYFKDQPSAATGWPWAAAAVGLLLLTIIFGSGPEGSGVKVNLFGFQPSELVRFLLLFFLAGFFTANEAFISGYATAQKRWRFFYLALATILAAIFLFLMLGDLGPAMVVCFTFIILFSFSRGDFGYMIASIIGYALLVWLVKNVWLATGITAALLALVFLFIRKQISESAIMALTVIAGFLLLDEVPFLDRLFPGPIQRLSDRKAIWENAWNNEVFGGDQVANGIWAMSSGGIHGQGIGEGFAKTIPEAHTDMILPAFGEEFGWAGIITIFLLFVILLHRAIVIGRQTGRPFLFYLSAGIGISTFVQFVLIAGGSTGALPLSGVALPFVSYGGSSLIINMLAAGFLLSVSMVQGSPVQMGYIKKQQDRNLMPALAAAFIGITLLGANVSRYLFNNKRWVVEPALVAERSGARMYSYNPRIEILMNRLQAGNLYDRNNLLLATSKPEAIVQNRDTLLKAGLQTHLLEALSHKRLQRYYPFGEQMFFWTGDANSGVFTGGNNAYFAEYQHAAELRGFPIPTSGVEVVASRYREDRFLPQTTREMMVARKDYRAISPLLLAGVNSELVDSAKQSNRDMRLTLDAALQMSIQQSLQANEAVRKSRVSVVVMDASNGDVLASSMYPLPPVDNWDLLTLPQREIAKFGQWVNTMDPGFTHATQPGSTVKLLTALAAFNKLGDAAANKTFRISPNDLVRTRGDEPDEAGSINLQRAIVKSNNPYFIKLANEENLHEEMATLYIQTGMFLRGVGGYYYSFDGGNAFRAAEWRNLWRDTEFRSKRRYDPNNIRATRGLGISGMAWGQGELVGTPASVARLAAGIANGGILMDNRYVLQIADSLVGVKDSIVLAKNAQHTALLTQFMKQQSASKVGRLGIAVAGKTGTPERIIRGKRINDGWYVFFAPKASGGGHIATCIRIEDTRGSSIAVQLAGTDVIPHLLRMGYIKGFDK